MQKADFLLLFSSILSASLLVSPVTGTASTPPSGDQLIICTSLKTGATFISKTGLCNPRIYEARTWYKLGTAPLGTPGSAPIDLITCQSKGSATQIIRSRTACNRTTQNTARWQRPLGPATAPAISSVVMGLQGTATLKIEPPVNDGGSRITSYIVTTNPGGVTTTLTPDQIRAAQITGLKPGTTYSFSTVAVNAKSPSPLSTVTTPALAPTTPAAPTIISVVATGSNTAQLTFTAPADNGGSPITSYVVTAMPGGLRTTVAQAGGGTIDISNLSPSTNYTFTITANNAAGASSAAPAPLTITTATPPPPPEPVAVAPSAPVDTVISIAAIAGVTAPVTGATPITVTTAGTGYTGTVTWSGSTSTFAAATTYTATITLTATSGYTLTGVTANFFTVAGATTVTHSANSGVITALFPATAIAAPAFTLSALSETRTVNTVATGFTINSTGGAISSFTISPAAPAGMSFNTATGAFTGTPTSVAAATTYTVTGTNATGSTTRSFSFTVSAAVAVYSVGQTGPGGGKIFYVATTPFACGPERATTCTYLEVAPSGWYGGADPQQIWGLQVDITEIANEGGANNSGTEIGLGYKNSELIVARNGTASVYAARTARTYTNNSLTDWYLPTTAELNLLCQWSRNVTQNVSIRCAGGTLNSGTGTGGGFTASTYWSSSEIDQYFAWVQSFNTGGQSSDNKLAGTPPHIRPIRAF